MLPGPDDLNAECIMGEWPRLIVGRRSSYSGVQGQHSDMVSLHAGGEEAPLPAADQLDLFSPEARLWRCGFSSHGAPSGHP
jgi:hypothetical protein